MKEEEEITDEDVHGKEESGDVGKVGKEDATLFDSSISEELDRELNMDVLSHEGRSFI